MTDSELFRATAEAMRKAEGTHQAGAEKKRMAQQFLLDSSLHVPLDVSSVAIEALLWAINNKKEISSFLKKNCCCCG